MIKSSAHKRERHLILLDKAKGSDRILSNSLIYNLTCLGLLLPFPTTFIYPISPSNQNRICKTNLVDFNASFAPNWKQHHHSKLKDRLRYSNMCAKLVEGKVGTNLYREKVKAKWSCRHSKVMTMLTMLRDFKGFYLWPCLCQITVLILGERKEHADKICWQRSPLSLLPFQMT